MSDCYRVYTKKSLVVCYLLSSLEENHQPSRIREGVTRVFNSDGMPPEMKGLFPHTLEGYVLPDDLEHLARLDSRRLTEIFESQRVLFTSAELEYLAGARENFRQILSSKSL